MSSRVYPLSAPGLAERVEATEGRERARRVHVEVDGRLPGLVVSWTRDDAGAWLAQVAYLAGPGRLAVEWLAADRLRPL